MAWHHAKPHARRRASKGHTVLPSWITPARMSCRCKSPCAGTAWHQAIHGKLTCRCQHMQELLMGLRQPCGLACCLASARCICLYGYGVQQVEQGTPHDRDSDCFIACCLAQPLQGPCIYFATVWQQVGFTGCHCRQRVVPDNMLTRPWKSVLTALHIDITNVLMLSSWSGRDSSSTCMVGATYHRQLRHRFGTEHNPSD